MKQRVQLFLTVILMVLALVCCGPKPSPTSIPPTPTVTQASPPQRPSPTGTPIALIRLHQLYSPQIEDHFKIYVGLPKNYDPNVPAGYHVGSIVRPAITDGLIWAFSETE